MKKLFVGVIALVGFAFLVTGGDAGDKKPLTIKQIMAKAMKGKAYQKMDKAEQIAMFTDLAANTPPAGEAASWKAKTEALLAAAKDGDAKKLDAAANCGACHKPHQKK